MPFNIGPGELIIVLIIALIVVGPGKLPDVGAALGKSIKEFRKAATDVKESTSLDAPAAVTAGAAPAAAAAPTPNVISATAAPNAIETATPNTISTPPAPDASSITPDAVPEPVEPSDEQPAPTA